MSFCSTPSCNRNPEKGRSRCRTCRRKKGTPKPSFMRVLFVDIETSPNLAYVWGLFKQNVSINQLVNSTEMLCFAAKWLGEDTTEFYSQHEHGRAEMVAAAWDLLNQADVVVHWNGQSFDVPHLNREFLEHEHTPPSPFQQVDLVLAARKRFRFPSNKLQYVSTALGLPGKVEHEGFELWTKCMAGDAEAWARMEKYNRNDTELLEELYHVLLPWVPALPHRGLYGDSGDCPACGGEVVADGYYRTKLSKFKQYRCAGCGAWSRSSKREGGVKIQAAVL